MHVQEILHSFEEFLQMSQNLFWSISSKYLTVSILGSYTYFSFFSLFIISYGLYSTIWSS